MGCQICVILGKTFPLPDEQQVALGSGCTSSFPEGFMGPHADPVAY